MPQESIEPNLVSKNFEKEQLRVVLDPADIRGVKNRYIDLLHKTAITNNLNLTGKETVLDFGCGNGRFAVWLAEKAKHVFGLDLNYEMLRQARKICPPKNTVFVQSNGSDTPFLDKSFDLILSVGVLQTISEPATFEKIVAELSRVCKQKGVIFAIEQVSKNPEDKRRTPKEYVETFQNYGFIPLVNRPIRSGRSIFIKAVSQGMVPQFLLKSFAQLELNYTRFKKTPVKGYHDRMMIFTKR